MNKKASDNGCFSVGKGGGSMGSSEYWRKRFLELEEGQHQQGEEYYKDLQNQFRTAQNNIALDIEHWYQRLADNNGISLASAKKLLKKDELEEFHWTVEQYIKAGEENAINQQWMKQLENASAKYHISYLESMKLQMQQHCELLSAKYQGSMTDFLGKEYADGFYHSVFEIQSGKGVYTNLTRLDTKNIDNILTKPWAVDGKNFSDRIWTNKEKLVKELHNELTQCLVRGYDPQKAIDNLAKIMNVSKAQAGRLIMTELAAIKSMSRLEAFRKMDLDEYEIVATLDGITSEICQEMDGRHFKLSDFEVGATAPPFHPNCRTDIAPYFDDEFDSIGERAARDENGGTHTVPSDMTYKEWKESYVKGSKSELTEGVNDSKMKSEGDDVSLEYQRYGRNKETTVNHTYIDSGEYRNKFDSITDNISVNRVLYAKSKEILNHRSGTKFEDMYWINGTTGMVIASALNEQKESGIQYTDAILKAISGKPNLIVFHNHPNSMPPSAADFNSMLVHGYETAFIICHDGKIIQYVSREKINERLYTMYIQEYVADGYAEYEAQWKALEKLKENYDIDFWEVLP